MNADSHELEHEYGLSLREIMDAVARRFRARVTLEGVVAEVHLGKHLADARRSGIIENFEQRDVDGEPDYLIWLPNRTGPLRIECKNVRNSDDAYRTSGSITAFKVEVQKTRNSKDDKSSRFYGKDQFEILAVCLGKKTKCWSHFVYISVQDLLVHPKFAEKLAVMHRVPLSLEACRWPWHSTLDSLLRNLPQ